MLLSITAQLSSGGTEAAFVGDGANDQLWLRVNTNYELEYSTNGTAYQTDLSSLDLADNASLSVNLGGGTNELHLANRFLVPVTVTGGAGQDTLYGPNAAVEWALTGSGSGTLDTSVTFSGIEKLVGGSAADSFIAKFGSLSGGIDGGGGSDTLLGPNTANTWSVTGSNAGTLNGTLNFTAIANLTGGNAADEFAVFPNGSLSGTLDGGDTTGSTTPNDALDFSAWTAPVDVNLAAATAGTVASFSNLEIIRGGSGSGDTLKGPGTGGVSVAWKVTGTNAGEVATTKFSGFENLTGQDTVSDTFTFEQSGSLSGTVDGGLGAGTTDGFSVYDSSQSKYVAFQPATASASGTVVLGSQTIHYAGMESLTPLSGDDINRVISGSLGGDNILLEDADPSTPGFLKVSYPARDFSMARRTPTVLCSPTRRGR